MRPILIAPLIALFCCTGAQAASEPAGELVSQATSPATSKPAAIRPGGLRLASKTTDLTGRTVFQVLLGEIALQRGDFQTALAAYVDLSRRSMDAKVISRAVEIATFSRQFELALELNELWQEVEPDSPRAQQSMATVLILLNRIEQLAPRLALLLKNDPTHLADNLLRLNRMLARHADKQAVQQLVDQVVAPYAGVAEAHYAMAIAAANVNDAARAQKEADEAVALRPDWEPAMLIATQLRARQSPAQATEALVDFVARAPNAREARLMLARLLITEKRYTESRQHFDHLLKEFPDNPEIIYPVAMLALQQNDTSTGKAQLEKLLKGDFADKNSVHFFLGQIEEEQRNIDAALTHYQAVDSGSQYIPARGRAAQLLVQQGRINEAQALVSQTAGRTAEEKVQLTLAESQLLRELKKPDAAYELVERALMAHPDNTELLYDAALLAERLGKFEVTEARLQQLLSIKPDHAHGLNALGYAWADRGLHLDKAAELIARAQMLLPDDPFIMDSMGWVLFRQGKTEAALETLQRAYRLKADPEIAAHLVQVLWALNRQGEAREVLEAASARHPGNEELAATRKKLLP